ncbi:hypothetical protein C8039_02225 [Halogeometricum sp. wsp3]|nr:hypothetical protein C8039_02225 [Halogeometricum sp. wsp3]
MGCRRTHRSVRSRLLRRHGCIHARDHGSNAKLAWTALAFFIPLVGAPRTGPLAFSLSPERQLVGLCELPWNRSSRAVIVS